MKHIYFLNDPENGFETFLTAEERDNVAAESIEHYLQDGWDESVTNVVTGVITHVATQTNRVERPSELDEDGCDEDGYDWDEFDHRCDYKMLPVTKES